MLTTEQVHSVVMDSERANVMQEAVQGVFIHLPLFLQTKEVEAEIAAKVARSRGDYLEVALMAAVAVFDRYRGRVRPAKLERMHRQLKQV